MAVSLVLRTPFRYPWLKMAIIFAPLAPAMHPSPFFACLPDDDGEGINDRDKFAVGINPAINEGVVIQIINAILLGNSSDCTR